MLLQNKDITPSKPSARSQAWSSRFSYYGDISGTLPHEGCDPIAACLAGDGFSYELAMDVLVHWYQRCYGVDMMVQAKDEFFHVTGRVFPDDRCYHQRMQYFLDYFLIQRSHVYGGGVSPFGLFLNSKAKVEHEQSALLTEQTSILSEYVHSFFVIVKSDEKRVVVRDVFSSQKIELFRPTHDFYRGLIKKQIIHGFLFQKQGLGFLSQGFLIHPQWALRSIEKISKKVSFTLDQQLDVLFDFAKKHLLYSRNPNLDVKKIYT